MMESSCWRKLWSPCLLALSEFMVRVLFDDMMWLISCEANGGESIDSILT